MFCILKPRGVMTLLLAASFFVPSFCLAASTVSETFTSLDYADLTNTTAEWNTRYGQATLARSFQPSLKGSLDTSGTAQEIIVDGNYAYIADGSSGLEIIDISNPASPTLTGNYNVSNLNMTGIAKSGNYIFGADQNENGGSIDVEVIDVSTPSAPTRATSISILAGFADAVDTLVNDTTLYVLLDVHPSSADYDLVYAYDITPPTAPTQVDTLNISQSANLAPNGMYVSGSRLYVGQYTAGLNIINIADPTNISSAGEYDLGATAISDVVVKDGYAILSTSGTGTTDDITVLDIRSEVMISVAATLDLKYTVPVGLELSGNTLYVGTTTGGVMTLDVTSPASPSILQNHYEGGLRADDMHLVNGILYSAMSTNGLYAFDYSTPLSPTQNWQYNTSSATVAGRDMVASGNTLYVADTGLFIFDISDPTAPVFKGSVTTGCTEAWEIALSGSYAFVGCSGSVIRIYDVSNSSSPSQAGSISTSGDARGIYISGNTLYAAVSAAGLAIYNITNPLSATLTGSVDTPGTAGDVDVDGSTAYVADLGSGVTIINVSTPASPSVITTYDPGGSGHVRLQKEGNVLYTAALDTMYILNVSTPSSPSVTASFTPLNSGLRGFTVSGNFLYTSDSFSGIDYYDISTLASPSYKGSMDFQDSSSSSGIFDVLPFGASLFTVGNGDPTVFSSSLRHQSSGIVQTKTLDDVSTTIAHATLTITDSKPSSTSIAYQLSADGGTNWGTVTAGTEHNFTTTGSDLRLKATFSTTDATKTPSINDFSISYDTYRVPDTPTATVSSSTTQAGFSGSTYSGDLTHVDSSWEVYDANGTNSSNLVAFLRNSTSSKTSVTISSSFTFQNSLSGRDRLKPDTQYWVRVQYSNSQGSSSWSSLTSFTTSNQDPTTSTISSQSWSEDSTSANITLSSYFTDPDSMTMTYAAKSSDTPDHITVSIHSTTSVVTFTPESNWYGTDTVTFTASDGTKTKDSNSVTLTVSNVNDAPSAPSDFTFADGAALSSLTPSLSWKDASDPDDAATDLSYTLRLGSTKGKVQDDYVTEQSTKKGEPSLQIEKKLTENTTYYYIVKTTDPSSATSDWSPERAIYINSKSLPDITVIPSVEILSSQATWYQPIILFAEKFFRSGVTDNFFHSSLAQLTNDPPVSLWIHILQEPALTYFFLFVALSSFLFALFSVKKIEHALVVVLFSPNKSFPKVAPSDDKGLWTLSYSDYKLRASVSRGMFMGGIFLLIAKILVGGLIGAFLIESSLPVQGSSVDGEKVYPGQKLKYTIIYQNNGDGTATNLHIINTLSDAVSLIDGSITFKGKSGLSPVDDKNISQTGQRLDFAFDSLSQYGTSGYNGKIQLSVKVKSQVQKNVASIENAVKFIYDQTDAYQTAGPVRNNLPSGYAEGKVFKDTDNDGVQDIREIALSGIKLFLYGDTGPRAGELDDADELLQSAISDSLGGYGFYHLGVGTYFIRLDTTALSFTPVLISPSSVRTLILQRDDDTSSLYHFALVPSSYGTADTVITSTSSEKDAESPEPSPLDGSKPASSLSSSSKPISTSCLTLLLEALNNQSQTKDRLSFKKGQNITFEGKACPDEKILVSLSDQSSILSASASGEWNFILDSDVLLQPEDVINFSLLGNRNVSFSVQLIQEQATTLEKIQNIFTGSSSVVAAISQPFSGENYTAASGIILFAVFVLIILLVWYHARNKK